MLLHLRLPRRLKLLQLCLLLCRGGARFGVVRAEVEELEQEVCLPQLRLHSSVDPLVEGMQDLQTAEAHNAMLACASTSTLYTNTMACVK